jgi:hypothetical protein
MGLWLLLLLCLALLLLLLCTTCCCQLAWWCQLNDEPPQPHRSAAVAVCCNAQHVCALLHGCGCCLILIKPPRQQTCIACATIGTCQCRLSCLLLLLLLLLWLRCSRGVAFKLQRLPACHSDGPATDLYYIYTTNIALHSIST